MSSGKVVERKADLPVHELAGACVINTFMITLALFDLSADLALGASDTLFLVKFHRFKSSAPIISLLLMILPLGLPMVLFQGFRGTLQFVFGWKRASTLRHVGDVVHFLTLVFCIAPTVVLGLLPRMNAFFEACDGKGLSRSTACEGQSRVEKAFLRFEMFRLTLSL